MKDKAFPGLLGRYYNGYFDTYRVWNSVTDPASIPTSIRIDRNIDFVWGTESPAWWKVQADNFLVDGQEAKYTFLPKASIDSNSIAMMV